MSRRPVLRTVAAALALAAPLVLGACGGSEGDGGRGGGEVGEEQEGEDEDEGGGIGY
jgi:hypothetical protein